MVPTSVRALVALLLLAVPLSGCVDSDAPPAATVEPAANATPEVTTLPDGREFAALEETNKTEGGLGGRIHTHDYWMGADRVVVFEDSVRGDLIPVFPSRDDTSHVFVAYLALTTVPGSDDRVALVYEGTGLVEFTIVKAPAWMTQGRVSFRTAAQDWTEPVPVKVGETFAYEPSTIDTDVPHSSRSLWNWQVTADGPLPVLLEGPGEDEIVVAIAVVKADEVEEWPGHPAFYDGVDRRVVLENAQGRTTVQTAADVLLYGVEPDQLVPDKLVGMGTGALDVFVNITRLDAPVPSAGFTLFWRSADIPEYELGFNPAANETDGKTYAYWRLTLNETQLDAFYQPKSRFTFKVLMDPGNADVLRCYRCVPYTIEYTMTIVAHKDPDWVPPVDDPSMSG